MNRNLETHQTLGAIIKEAVERHQAFIKVDLKAAAKEGHLRVKREAKR